MFKIVAILAICWLSVSQAFDCESPCPKHSKCVAQDKCECEYGYKNAIDEFDGLPYCQWQGTTTTKRTSTSSDNEGFHEDYSHEEDHKQDIESNSTSKVNGIRKPPVIMEESQIIIEGSGNENFKEITTEIVPETSTEMWNMETSTVMATIESDTETNTETTSETTSEAITEIPTSSEILDLTATTQETNDVVLHNVHESHHHHNDAGDDFQKFQLNKISQKENFSSEVENSLDTTTEDVEVTTVRGAIKVVKITKHVEQIIYKNTANQTFYTFLGILCPSLAFIFAMAVLFDCVKL